jgi:hypothetical protein
MTRNRNPPESAGFFLEQAVKQASLSLNAKRTGKELVLAKKIGI